jgi:dTDP-4-amino-4,6-dideoxygalactose transaminase
MSADNVDAEFRIPQYPSLEAQTLQVKRGAPGGRLPGRQYSAYLARSAIYLALQSAGIGAGQAVLVPAYICRTAVEPLLAAGTTVEFYNVNQLCEVDLADLQSRIRPETAAILAVHYFGFPAPIDQLRDICDTNGLLLIEDCAHVFGGMINNQPMGSFGDVSVFSWRKFVPLYDGALLCLNRPDLSEPSTLSSVPYQINARSAAHAVSSIEAVDRAKRWLRRGKKADLEPAPETAPPNVRPANVFETYSDDFNPSSAEFSMSWPSRFLLEHMSAEKVAAIRAFNFELLSDCMAACPGLEPLHTRPPPGGAAWVFPVLVRGSKDAHKKLRNMGIPATAWDGVKPAQLDGSLADAEFLYHHLIFLPVHQGLSEADIGRIGDSCQRLSRIIASSPV